MLLKANIIREGKWWIAECQLDDGYEYGTQAKNLTELDTMILDAAKTVGYNPQNLEITKTIEFDNTVAEYATIAAEEKAVKEKLGIVARKTAATLKAQNLTVRDIAQLMQISPARVSQLLAT